MAETPTNAVLEERIENDREATRLYRQELKEQVTRIEAAVTKTNGRVTSLELWRMFIIGALAALTAPYASKLVALFSHP